MKSGKAMPRLRSTFGPERGERNQDPELANKQHGIPRTPVAPTWVVKVIEGNFLSIFRNIFQRQEGMQQGFSHLRLLFAYLLKLILLHHKEISIYVFPEKELPSLSPNFHIHVSVSDLCLPTIGPPSFLQQNRQTDRGNM